MRATELAKAAQSNTLPGARQSEKAKVTECRIHISKFDSDDLESSRDEGDVLTCEGAICANLRYGV
jgi:hypothetical protein